MDERDLTSLYERYGFAVHRRCVQLLQNRHEAEDALQEVFLRALRYRHTYSGGSQLAWLYSIAANHCFDVLSKRKKVERFDQVHTTNDADVTDSDRQAAVGILLRTFDGKTRAIGVLHHLGGLTQDEVAAETGFSRKTVGKKLKAFEDAFRTFFGRGAGDE